MLRHRNVYSPAGSPGRTAAQCALVSRNGQDVASGVYVFSVEADGFDRKVGKFIVIR